MWNTGLGGPDPEGIKLGLFWRGRGGVDVIIILVLKYNKN